MREKKVDFAWFGPFSYVLAHERAGAEALQWEWMQGQHNLPFLSGCNA